MVEEVKDSFKEGYDFSRFIISTVTEKKEDGKYLCKGRVVQGRAENSDELDWDDRTITSESLGDNPQEVENMVLNGLFEYLVSKRFYLFED